MRPDAGEHLRYEVCDRVPKPLALGLGVQLAVLCINGVVLMPSVVFRAGGAEEFLLWGVFASVLACGVSSILQAARMGRIGGGYVLAHGSSAIFLAVCVAALSRGGPGMLATMVVLSAGVQLLFAARLSLLHRILTPIVAGTVVMLLPVTVMPVLFGMLNEIPPGAPEVASPLSAGVTIAVTVGIVLKAGGKLRLWGPAIGIAAGALVGAALGIYDGARVADAAWIGVPVGHPPGLDLDFGADFWALLPAFLFVAVVGSTKSVAIAVAAQRLAWRKPRAVDYRAVQRALAAKGTGNLFAGFAGTMPTTLFAPSVTAVEVTGVAARGVGFATGLVFIALAFLPKLLALILAIPVAVVAAGITVTMTMLFMVGMREVLSHTGNPRSRLICGISFWAGIGLEFDMVFPTFFGEFAGGLFSNGMTAGGLLAILLTLVTVPRQSRLKCELDVNALAGIRGFIEHFAARHGLRREVVDRLDAASEETLLALQRPHEEEWKEAEPGDGERRALTLTAHRESEEVVMEFKVGVIGGDQHNLQDRLAWLADQGGATVPERDISLRLLRHLTSSVRHQQYHNTEIVTLRVDTAARRGRSERG